MIRCRKRFKLSFVTCVISIGVLFNGACVYYLHKSPSPWMSQYGPFQMSFNKQFWTCRPVFRSHGILRTALVSFPGSGNTWLRHMIQQVTGIATGSVYNDSFLYNQGFPAEGIHDETVILIKTHEWGEKERDKYEKAVILIRDPFDALRAEFNRQRRGHLGLATYSDYKTHWPKFIHENARLWNTIYLDWLQFKGPVHVIHFEKLRKETAREIQKLLQFLSVPYSKTDMTCMMKNRDGRFKRNGARISQPFQKFSYYMKMSIKSYRSNITKELYRFISRN